MGMFDNMRCYVPLPVAGANAVEYQTKDTDAQELDNYEIREDGTLWHQDYDLEQRIAPNASGPLGQLWGSIARVHQRWEPVPLTGSLRFYGNDDAGHRLEFLATFEGGKLKELKTIRAPNA
ncbi:MAG: hypothetical protein ACLPXB_05480 [Thiobacillaceae bacterium]